MRTCQQLFTDFKCFSRHELTLHMPNTHDVSISLGCRTSMRPGCSHNVWQVTLVTILCSWSKQVHPHFDNFRSTLTNKQGSLALLKSRWAACDIAKEQAYFIVEYFGMIHQMLEWIKNRLFTRCTLYFYCFPRVYSVHSGLSQGVGLSWVAQQLQCEDTSFCC